MDYLPAGTATGNDDATRQAPISQFFYLVADVLGGVDSQPRNEPGMTNGSGLAGPSATFGVDVGVGADGQVYVRGRAGPEATGQAAAAASAAKPVGERIAQGALNPLLVIGLVVGLWFAFGK